MPAPQGASHGELRRSREAAARTRRVCGACGCATSTAVDLSGSRGPGASRAARVEAVRGPSRGAPPGFFFHVTRQGPWQAPAVMSCALVDRGARLIAAALWLCAAFGCGDDDARSRSADAGKADASVLGQDRGGVERVAANGGAPRVAGGAGATEVVGGTGGVPASARTVRPAAGRSAQPTAAGADDSEPAAGGSNAPLSSREAEQDAGPAPAADGGMLDAAVMQEVDGGP